MTLQYHPLDLAKMSDIAQHINCDDNFTILEFGVATGNTLCAMLDALIQMNMIPKHVYGFDSFQGLPKEDPTAAYNPEWFPGAFNIVDELKNKNIEANIDQGIRLVMLRLSQYLFDIKLVVGWYSDLTNEMSKGIYPANYIHIDCDMYISAYQALKWIATNQLIADGCIIRYDDWQYDANMGENKAHHQICKEFGYKAQLIPSQYTHNIMFRFYK